MDKLKIFLAAVKKHQFWVCCGVMLVTSLGCWWWASGEVTQRFVKRSTEIDGDFKGAVVQSGAPNQGVIDKIKQQQDDLKLKVYDAWKTLYAEEKKNDPFPTKLLGEQFKKEFTKLQLPNDQLEPKYLDIYQNHIASYVVPTLEQIVKARHEVVKEDGTAPRAAPAAIRPRTPVGGRGFGGDGRGGIVPPSTVRGNPMRPHPPAIGPGVGLGGDADKEYTGIVDWDGSSVLTHFDWGGRPPTTLEVVMAQEDLGVYEMLLGIIKKVNEGATTQANAAIKQIVALDIGKDSATAWDAARAAAIAPGGGASDHKALGDRHDMGTAQAQNLSSSQQGEQTLFDGRYVDEKGKPLLYTSEYPHAAHPNREFKMMPIFLDLVMDQRYLPTLLVQCANSTIPIEVRLVRILKQPDFAALGGGTPTTGGLAGTGQPVSAAGREMPRSRPGPIRRDIGVTNPRASGGAQDTAGQFDVPVEIYGIIYIYNPPDRAKLGIPEEKAPAETTAPANATSPPTNGAAARPSPAATPGK